MRSRTYRLVTAMENGLTLKAWEKVPFSFVPMRGAQAVTMCCENISLERLRVWIERLDIRFIQSTRERLSHIDDCHNPHGHLCVRLALM